MCCFIPCETRSFCLGGCFPPFCMLKANKPVHFNGILCSKHRFGSTARGTNRYCKTYPQTQPPPQSDSSTLPPHHPPCSGVGWIRTKQPNGCGHPNIAVFSTNNRLLQQDVPVAALPGSAVNSPEPPKFPFIAQCACFPSAPEAFPARAIKNPASPLGTRLPEGDPSYTLLIFEDLREKKGRFPQLID